MRAALTVLLLAMVACAPVAAPAPTRADPEAVAPRGIGLSPRSFDQADFVQFLDLVDDAGGTLALVGDWGQVAEDGSAFETVARIGTDRDFDVLLVVAPNSAGVLLRPLDEATVDRYVADLGAFMAANDVDYLGIGNEVNLLAANDPEAFDAFVDLFGAAVEAARTADPDVVVFPVFQYEWLVGDRTGLYGGELVDPQWHLLDRFPQADAVGLTTYPGLIFTDPRDIPSGFYDQIAEQTELPVVFTEVGWHAGLLPRGWESSEDEQARFVERFLTLTAGLAPRLVVWPFLFDTLVTDVPFDTMGLRRPDGTARPAWEAWRITTGSRS